MPTSHLRKLMLILSTLCLLLVVTPTLGQAQSPNVETEVLTYLSDRQLAIAPDTSAYEVFLRDALMGEYPDLLNEVGENAFSAYALTQLGLTPDPNPDWQVEGPASFKSTIFLPFLYQRERAVGTQAIVAPAATLGTYNRDAAAAYALNWAENGKKKRNSSYPNFDNDCTNFASQAAFAGGIPQRGSGECRDENNTSEWYVKRSAWWCIGTMREWAWSTPWSVVYPFRSYLWNQGYAYGRTYSRTAAELNQLIYDAWQGDFIQLQASGTSYHTMVVTSWDANDVYLTYHTGPGGNDVVRKSLRELDRTLPSDQRFILIRMKRTF